MKTKHTKDCFKGDKYLYRDSNIDSWLPKKQEVKKTITLEYKSFENKTFQEIYGSNPETFSLVEIENLVENNSDKLLKNGWGNFFPVESNDGLSVVDVYRHDVGQWNVDVYRFDYGRWRVGRRFFSRNGFDTPTLGTFDTSVEKAIEIVKGAGYKVIKEI